MFAVHFKIIVVVLNEIKKLTKNIKDIAATSRLLA